MSTAMTCKHGDQSAQETDISLTISLNLPSPDKLESRTGVVLMNQKQAYRLGQYVREKRKAQHLSARELAGEAGVDTAQILRLERGEISAPQATVLGSVAAQLRVPVNDLLVLAGYPTSRQLPSIEPYLRAKYPALQDEQVRKVVALVATSPGRGSPS